MHEHLRVTVEFLANCFQQKLHSESIVKLSNNIANLQLKGTFEINSNKVKFSVPFFQRLPIVIFCRLLCMALISR